MSTTETSAAVAQWHAVKAAHSAHAAARPAFPNFRGMTPEQHKAAATAWKAAEHAYWTREIALDRAERAAFEAMARTLPVMPDEPLAQRPFTPGCRTRYMAVQVKATNFDAYPALCAMTVDAETGSILARSAWLCDDAVAEAARRNAA